MKAKVLIALTIAFFAVCGCKKTKTNPDGIDINKAISSNTLFSTWIIDDDHIDKFKETQNSSVFTNRSRVKLTFNKDRTYTLNFTDSVTHKSVSENGTWYTNTGNNQLMISGPSNEYTVVINQLDEEDLIMTNLKPATKSVTNSEGVSFLQNVTEKEMLYMEDDD